MTRYEFLNTLKAAMHGLPPATIDRVLGEHERRFDEGMALGRSESDIARELGDPFAIADALRVPPAAANASTTDTTDAKADRQHGVAKAVRVFVSSLGLLVFNTFMVIPAMIYSFLLLMFYMVAIACYFGGIVLTASSLSGVNDMTFRLPFEQVVVESGGAHGMAAERHAGRVRVDINDDGIRVEDGGDRVAAGGDPSVIVRHGSEALVVADRSELRSLKAWHGAGIVLGGVLLLLLSALITKYTWIGMKRYVQMNISLLRTA
jgi:uncharacterized membrane protein